MTQVKTAFALAAAVGAMVALSGPASSMPLGGLGADVDAAKADTSAQQVRWVCGPYGGCVWRPRYYAPVVPYYGGYGYYGPRYYGGYGYGRGYRYGGRGWRRW